MQDHVQAEPGGADSDVRSTISYMVAMAQKPARFLCTPPAGAPELNWQLAPQPVQIADGRSRLASLSLDKHGFTLRPAPPAAVDFYDETAVVRAYYPAVEKLVSKLTGAHKVLAFDYNLRSGSKADRLRTGAHPPARFAHADYTPTSAPQRVRDLLPEQEASERLAQRYVFFNVWRPIGGPVQDEALSLCDLQTVAPDDLVATDLIYADRVGEFYNVMFNPNHRWYYFRHMRSDEVIVLTAYDSHTQQAVPHSGFDDPTAATDAPPRESIEVRVIAFF